MVGGNGHLQRRGRDWAHGVMFLVVVVRVVDSNFGYCKHGSNLGVIAVVVEVVVDMFLLMMQKSQSSMLMAR